MQLQNLRLEIVSSQKDIDALNSDIVFAKSTGNENLERKAELNQEIERIKSVILEKTELINSTNAEIEELIANQNERSKAIEKSTLTENSLKNAVPKSELLSVIKHQSVKPPAESLPDLKREKSTFRSSMMILSQSFGKNMN